MKPEERNRKKRNERKETLKAGICTELKKTDIYQYFFFLVS